MGQAYSRKSKRGHDQHMMSNVEHDWSDGEFFKGDGGDEDVKPYGAMHDDNSGLVGRDVEKPSVDKKL